MSEEEMKVKVTKNTPVRCYDDGGTVLEHVTAYYPAGFEGTAPRSHIDQIVKAGAGQVVEGGQAPAKGQKVAENQDAFKSGSDNVSIG